MQDRDLAVRLVQGTQVRQSQCVVTAQGEQLRPVGAHLIGGAFDFGDGFFDVEGVDAQVTAVGDLLPGECVDVRGLVVGAQQLRGLTDVGGTETGTGTVADAGIEGDAEDLDVDLLTRPLGFDLVDAREQAEGRWPGESWCLAVIGWSQGLSRHRLSFEIVNADGSA